jgi:hypothetical protein
MSDTAKEIEAVAYLLEHNYGFDEYDMLGAYQSFSYNIIDGVEHPYLVHFGESISHTASFEERAFPTAIGAAEFYVTKKHELSL